MVIEGFMGFKWFYYNSIKDLDYNPYLEYNQIFEKDFIIKNKFILINY